MGGTFVLGKPKQEVQSRTTGGSLALSHHGRCGTAAALEERRPIQAASRFAALVEISPRWPPARLASLPPRWLHTLAAP